MCDDRSEGAASVAVASRRRRRDHACADGLPALRDGLAQSGGDRASDCDRIDPCSLWDEARPLLLEHLAHGALRNSG
jgi:hypothetical protein